MSSAVAEPASTSATWLRRLRFALALAAAWGLFAYVGTGFVLPADFDRPPVLLGPTGLGLGGGLVFVLLIWVSAGLAALILRPCTPRDVALVVGTALAAWAARGGRVGGTIDTWLLLQHDAPTSPTRGPYWLLLGDYVLLAVGVVGVLVIAAALGDWSRTWAERARAALGLGRRAADRRREWGALAIAAVVAAVLIVVLTGPAAGATYRGQVYFAVALGLAVGVFAARQLTHVTSFAVFWSVPLLLGVAGTVGAGLWPTLLVPAGYAGRDTIPAWGLVRALPVEMVGVGLAALALMRRDEPRGGPQPGAS